jgi:hypothetical protein
MDDRHKVLTSSHFFIFWGFILALILCTNVEIKFVKLPFHDNITLVTTLYQKNCHINFFIRLYINDNIR